MDKDIERLGRERLLRQKIHKNWMRILAMLAVVVLGITFFQLIQPASAEDKDKTEFTVDDKQDTYTNLLKLSNPPSSELASQSGSWNGDNFDISVNLDFAITKDEAASAGTNYYYVFSEGVYISDKLCEKWYDHQDKTGTHAFSYHFVKTDDGRYAVLIKFQDGYIDNDITAGIKFNCSAKGEVKEDGDVEISIGGEVYVTVDSTDIEWNKNTSVNYDIKVDKVSNTNRQVMTDESGNKYVEYSLNISSEKGTPDVITVSDILRGNGVKVNTSNPNIVVTKNGRNLQNWEYSARVEDKGNCTYELKAELPKLQKGESYVVTYRYYLDANDIQNGQARTIDNNVSVSSEDKNSHEKVIDTSSCQVSYKRSTVAKSGRYENGLIYWTIEVNSSHENIAGLKLTDNMLNQAASFKIESKDDTNGRGYRLNMSGDKVTSVEFTAMNNGMNTCSYTITYTTSVTQKYSDSKVTNTVNFDGEGTTAEVWIPGTGNVSKTLEGEYDDKANEQFILTWKSSFEIPDGGLPAGTVVKDELTTSLNTDDHYMTYAQVRDAFKAVTDKVGVDWIKNLKVKANNQWYDWTNLNEGSFAKYSGFQFEFANTVYKLAPTFDFTYNSTGSYASGVQTTYRNTVWVGSANATAEFKKDSKVKKTDGNGQEGKTEFVSEDGKLTWRVEAVIDPSTSKYYFRDNLPKGVTLDSLDIEIKYCNGAGFTLPSLDGTEYLVNDYQNMYHTSGIKVSTKINNVDGASLVDTYVERVNQCFGWDNDSRIYVTYHCHIDNYDAAEPGTKFTLKNTVKVSTEGVDDYGSDWQTQIVTKPGKAESGDDDDEHGSEVLLKDYVWNNSDKILNYTVTINPEGKDLVEGTDVLSLKDVVTYANRTYTGGNEAWEVHLIPSTVALYEAVRKEDGTLTTGNRITEWNWKYEEFKNPNEWQNSTATITAEVPDGKAMILKYSYNVNALYITSSWGVTRISISNEVSLEGVAKKKIETDSDDKYTDEGTSAYIYKNKAYTFYKVEKDNYGNLLPGAEFTVYKYNANNGQYEAGKTFVTDENGEFTVEFNLKDFRYNQQYFIMETKAPSGYLLPDEPEKFYFYFEADDTAKYPVVAEPGGFLGKDLSKDGYNIEYVENQKTPTTSIAVYKYWSDSDGNRVKRTEGSIFLQVYQIGQDGKSRAYGSLIEVKPDKDGDWYYAINGLPKNVVDDMGRLTSYEYKYFVEEVGIDEKYTMSGYTTSYVYIDQNGNGFIVTDGKKTVHGITGGSVEITNKSTAYELPATGGAGDRWLYMLSGFLLSVFAAITLIYKINKNKIIN